MLNYYRIERFDRDTGTWAKHMEYYSEAMVLNSVRTLRMRDVNVQWRVVKITHEIINEEAQP